MNKRLIFTILASCIPGLAYSSPVPIGNALLKPAALEKLVRVALVKALQHDPKIFPNTAQPTLKNDLISFQTTEGIEQSVEIIQKQGGIESEILKTLGVQDSVTFSVSPPQISFTLPTSDLKAEIKNTANNKFLINAKWSIANPTVKVPSIEIKVPKGVFDRPFTINSTPVNVSLTPRSAPILVEATAIAEATQEGTKIHLQSVKTNLIDNVHPDFQILFGPLTVEGKPLTLEVISNGHSLKTTEAKVRATLQQIGPSVAKTIREKLASGLQDQITAQVKALDEKEPISYRFNTDSLLESMNLKPEVRALIRGIDFNANLSFLQSIKSPTLISAQMTSNTCFDGSCVSDVEFPSPIGTTDLGKMGANDDAGVIIYESALQAIFHSQALQARIRNYYNEVASAPGVNLAPAGVKLYLNPNQNSVLAVLNLEIDIGKTKKDGCWDGFKKNFGDWIETWFGSGKFVKIPVEINLILNGLQKDMFGRQVLMVTSSLPFHSDGTFSNSGRCPNYECPSNVSEMRSSVRTSFLASVEKQIREALPATIAIPIDQSVEMSGITIAPKTFQITPNHGVLISGQLRQSNEGKQ